MSLNRYAKRKDANQSELVSYAEQLGAVWIEAPPLDGWVLWRGVWTPVEVKRPDGPRGGRSDRHYTQAQVGFMALCQRCGAPVWTWRDLSDVMNLLGAQVGA